MISVFRRSFFLRFGDRTSTEAFCPTQTNRRAEGLPTGRFLGIFRMGTVHANGLLQHGGTAAKPRRAEMIAKKEYLERSEHDPTPDEIRERTAHIRRRWTSRERKKRSPAVPRWSPPVCPLKDLPELDPEQN